MSQTANGIAQQKPYHGKPQEKSFCPVADKKAQEQQQAQAQQL